MNTFDELKTAVENIQDNTGDALNVIGWKLDDANDMERRWGRPLIGAHHSSKQRRRWANKRIKYGQDVAYYTELLSVARTVICPHCGDLLTDDHQLITVNGYDGEPDEESCNQVGMTIIPF